jgi:hypothetical protein
VVEFEWLSHGLIAISMGSAVRQVWNFIRLKSNRERLAWLGGGAVVVVAGLWTGLVYFFPPDKGGGGGGPRVDADCGSVAIGGGVTGSTVTAGSPAKEGCARKPK